MGHGPEPDRVLAAVVFLNIVASTERAAQVGDRRWRDLLEHYRATVREQLARYRGREVDTAGDGFVVTFDGPLEPSSSRAQPWSLCGHSTSKLVAGSGLEFVHRGLYVLKGVPGEWQLYAVAGESRLTARR